MPYDRPNPQRPSQPQRPSGQRPNNSHSRQKKRNMRYDRLLALIVVLVLLIIVLVKCTSSCGKGGGGGQSNPATTTTVFETQPATEAVQDQYANTVYISPSNQSDNTFATGDTNEAVVCRAIAEQTAALLQQAGVTVIVAGESDSLQQKTAMGDNGLAAYVGIQTNQGAGSGTSCFYNSTSAQSQALAQAVYDPVATLTERDDNGLIDGAQVGSDSYQYEVASNNSPCCLIEVEYHDTQAVAQWLIDNEAQIASAIASGICSYLGVAYPSAGGAAAGGNTATTTADTTTETSNAIQDQLSE